MEFNPLDYDYDSDSVDVGDSASNAAWGLPFEAFPGAVDEDDLYYVPERRPSLDLGTESSPGDSSPWW
ncbi:hypothetical protein NHX12_009834 [Muraenolepis orangiensis]|uniref:Uncharacterized protein n=1 Tax=Muraenolepis orangiensis TaxID=630683 RepID=A0A9Q0I7T9_9TELE|nr:hypothetical protein NHX12_009834 [Muraenolepis orangiensis]